MCVCVCVCVYVRVCVLSECVFVCEIPVDRDSGDRLSSFYLFYFVQVSGQIATGYRERERGGSESLIESHVCACVCVCGSQASFGSRGTARLQSKRHRALEVDGPFRGGSGGCAFHSTRTSPGRTSVESLRTKLR